MQTKLVTGLAILAFFQAGLAHAQELRELMKKQGYSRVTLTKGFTHNNFMISAKIDGHDCNLLLDTGAGDSIYIKRPIAEKLGIKLDQRLPNFDKVGRGVRSDIVGYGTANKLELGKGEYTINEQIGVTGSDGFEYPIFIYDEKTKKATSIEMDGLIGMQLLNEHQFVLDGVNSDLYLKSYAEEKMTSMIGEWQSLLVEQDEKKSPHSAKMSISKDRKVDFSFGDLHRKGDLLVMKYTDHDVFYVKKDKDTKLTDYILKGISRLKKDELELCLIDEDSFISQDLLWQNEKIFPMDFTSKKKWPVIYYKFKRIESAKIVETKK